MTDQRDPEQTLSLSLSAQLQAANDALTEARAQIEVFEAFIALTQAAASTGDLTVLAERAEEVLRASIPGLLAAYYELGDDRWVAQVSTDAVPDALLQVIRQGLSQDTPPFARAVSEGGPVFFEHWDAEEQRVPFTELFDSVALAPFCREGQPVTMLTVGFGGGGWTPQRRQLFTAVYQAMNTAQQRATLDEQRERRQALEAFVTLTEAVGTETDRVRLAERARDLLKETQPEWLVTYYELQGGLWRALVTDVPDPELRASLLAGLPQGTPGFAAAMQSAGPVFFEDWNAGEQQIELTEAYGAAAFYPYLHGGEARAMFTVGSRQRRRWSATDQAVFVAVGRSLALALDRVWNAAELEGSYLSLSRSNRELQSANEELEAFTYSASHDLRTPVRHVRSFSELARKALRGGDLDKAAHHMEVVETAAGRMGSLIDAMLELSRTTRQVLKKEAVDLGRLFEQAQQDVEGDAQGRHIEWQVGPLPTVRGDRATLQQVMTNLISNAVKFTRTREHAVIEVLAQDRPDEWLTLVRDNGAGFDPAYGDKLFKVFQRLHAQKDFEGTGVGLATVRRIILRHGGRVFASGEKGQGATFGFSLPK